MHLTSSNKKFQVNSKDKKKIQWKATNLNLQFYNIKIHKQIKSQLKNPKSKTHLTPYKY